MEQRRRLQLHVKCIATAVLDFNLSSKREKDCQEAFMTMDANSIGITIHESGCGKTGDVISIDDINKETIGKFLSILTNK